MTWNLSQHSYEEVREALIDILLGRANAGDAPRQFTDLVAKVGFVFAQRSRPPGRRDAWRCSGSGISAACRCGNQEPDI
jgi:hypothetical protein